MWRCRCCEGSPIFAGLTATIGALVLGLAGCVQPAAPAPAQVRTTPPPWDAPRDAVSFITAAGMEPQPLGLNPGAATLQLRIKIDSAPVVVPPYVGIDRPRAVQADVHTHDANGKLWLEGKAAGTVTLGQFFAVWGVRLDEHCLGAACRRLEVEADGRLVAKDPRTLRLAGVRAITITAIN